MAALQKIWRNRPLRVGLIAVILLASVVVFVRFFVVHPQYLTTLQHVRASTLWAVFGLNVLQLIALIFVYDFTLQLCGLRLPLVEQALLASYSAVVNFFGPLQSGPGVRAVYLKAKHQVRLRDYTLATLISYGLFATYNAWFLFGLSRPWWQALLLIVTVIIISLVVIRLFYRRGTQKDGAAVSAFQLRPKPFLGLMVAGFVQCCLLAACYFVELKAVAPQTTLHQAIIYSGAANFALFVSLTPDAIGFRESFLVLSRQLHHVSTAAILSANVIDRGVYVVFLLVLLVMALATHARQRLLGGQTAGAAERPPVERQ